MGVHHITGKRTAGVPLKAICGRKRFRAYMELQTYLKAVKSQHTDIINRVCLGCQRVANALYLRRSTRKGVRPHSPMTRLASPQMPAFFTNELAQQEGNTMSNATVTLNRNLIYINQYLEDRIYGGSEEGGWYYDSATFIGCFGKTIDPVAAQIIRDAHTPRIEELNEGRRPIWSVLSEGRYAIVIESFPGADYPAHRPYYE